MALSSAQLHELGLHPGKRILMFGWEFPPQITGGLGTACAGLSESLSRLVGHITFVLPKLQTPMRSGTVDVLGANEFRLPSTAPMPTRVTTKSVAGIEVHEVDSTLIPYSTVEEYSTLVNRYADGPQHGGVESGSGVVVSLSGAYGRDLYAEVRRFASLAGTIVHSRPFDIIHAHDWMTFPAGIAAKEASGLPLVVHVHALEFDRSGEHINQQIYNMERQGMEAADRIVAVSRRTKHMIVERYGIPAAKVHVVHNGATAGIPASVPSLLPEKIVVFLGRITMQKGPEYFLEAAYLVSKRLPNVRFVMAGSGDMMPRMVERMAELEMVDRFHFTGFVGEEKRHRLLSMADVFVMTSVSEPFGITPVEAIQHDVPVVLTKQSGVAEVLQSAIKVDFWDTRKIADAIIKILTEEGLGQALVEGARAELKGLTWEHAAQKVNSIYEELS